ncbi:hypothetical protein, partial [Klebsiella pneumoniae]|uniref:hypothetical protein n=1 Tax=Klebsiella pneumoniae TaxID=573 RepID=UPI001D02F19A
MPWQEGFCASCEPDAYVYAAMLFCIFGEAFMNNYPEMPRGQSYHKTEVFGGVFFIFFFLRQTKLKRNQKKK